MFRRLTVLFICWVCPPFAVAGNDLPPPMTVDEMRSHSFDVTLTRIRDLASGPGFDAYLVGYEHSGLALHAMIAVPTSEQPEAGFPIVIANHGYVPDPRRYGITAQGVDARPGDYYRSVPALFSSRGFLTVIPDYRGHNSSEGFVYIDPQDDDSVDYYAEDVVALMSALGHLDAADTNNVFMWSHSMGGSVSIRALLATDTVRASSFWSTMNVDEFSDRIGELDGQANVHHAAGDQSTPIENSESLARVLESAGLLASFSRYPEDDHFFGDTRRQSAAQLDADLFWSLVQ